MSLTKRTPRSSGATIEKLASLLDRIDPDCCYEQWMLALMVVFNETHDSEEGFELADEWSSRGIKYRGTDDVRSTWQYFDLNHPRPVGIATLVRMTKR